MNEARLRDLVRRGALADLDAHFAAFLLGKARQPSPALALAACMVSNATAQGHVCIDLAQLAGTPVLDDEMQAPPLDEWRDALLGSGVVGEGAPLVLEGDRLYLHRYWRYEREVADALMARAAAPIELPDDRIIAAALERWFPRQEGTDWQKIAATVATLKSLAVISGGPGTGKTTTVVRVLAILCELAQGAPLRIALAAPTGKAAARLQEVIRLARERLTLPPAIAAQLGVEATTLHRLLGVLPGRPRFRHDRDNPLPLDVLVIDEASMIDLALMAKTLDALPPRARLVVLGDKDQLASVEAGAVLGSVCAGTGRMSSAMASRVARLAGADATALAGDEVAPLADSVVFLRRSYRFDAAGGIGALAVAASAGDADAALRVLEQGSDAVTWIASGRHAELVERLARSYEPLIRTAVRGVAPEDAFAALRAHSVLCAHRGGPYGASTLNDAIEVALRRAGVIVGDAEWYAGRPVMVSRNDYALRLFNGDVGIALPDATGELGVFFAGADGSVRRIAPARVPECATAFAMTVHKSQGSEFDEVTVVLPDEPSPVLTRELVYTAVTRAASRLVMWGSAAVLRAALEARVQRDSGLAERLGKVCESTR